MSAMTRMSSLPRILDLERPDHAAVYRRNLRVYNQATERLVFRTDVRPEVHGAELLPFLTPLARLTGRWVLSESSIFNALSGAFSVAEPDGVMRNIQTGLGRIEILGMEAAIFYAGADEDNIAERFDRFSRFACATAERAICDWIYFAMRKKNYGVNGWCLGPAPDQTDLTGISLIRLKRLAEAMNIQENLERWLIRWRVVQSDEEVMGKYSKALGY